METQIIFQKICLAVNYLHDKMIVHRDLKLENILIGDSLEVKLIDFGFCYEVQNKDEVLDVST